MRASPLARGCYPILILAVLTAPPPLLAQEKPQFRALFDSAYQAEQNARYEEALQGYREVLTYYPRSQRAALQVGVCLSKLNRLDEAVLALDQAIAMDPLSNWGEVGLFQKAKCYFPANKATDARQAIAELNRRHPDSVYLAQATVLDLKYSGQPTTAAEAAANEELAAAKLHEQGRELAEKRQDVQALAVLQDVITRYPRSAASLRSYEALGHLYIRAGEFEKAKDAFYVILERLSVWAPDARIVQMARLRLAALHHKHGRPSDAIALYNELLQGNASPRNAEEARVQLAGIKFELLQRGKWKGHAIPPEAWDSVRALCDQAVNSPAATTTQRARADLMAVESFEWEGDDARLMQAAETFLRRHDPTKTRMETATVRLMYGQRLFNVRRFPEAIVQFQAIVDAYPTEPYIWPGDEKIPQALLRLWSAQYRVGDRQTAEATKQQLLSRFPDSSAAKLIRPDAPREAGAK